MHDGALPIRQKTRQSRTMGLDSCRLTRQQNIMRSHNNIIVDHKRATHIIHHCV